MQLDNRIKDSYVGVYYLLFLLVSFVSLHLPETVKFLNIHIPGLIMSYTKYQNHIYWTGAIMVFGYLPICYLVGRRKIKLSVKTGGSLNVVGNIVLVIYMMLALSLTYPILEKQFAFLFMYHYSASAFLKYVAFEICAQSAIYLLCFVLVPHAAAQFLKSDHGRILPFLISSVASFLLYVGILAFNIPGNLLISAIVYLPFFVGIALSRNFMIGITCFIFIRFMFSIEYAIDYTTLPWGLVIANIIVFAVASLCLFKYLNDRRTEVNPTVTSDCL